MECLCITKSETLWMLSCLVGGLGLGLCFQDHLLPADSACAVLVLSSVLGWTYFLSWTASFYPQILLNWSRKSVEGLSLDFQVLNVCGFCAYSFYNLLLFMPTSSARVEYISRYGEPPGVHLNDVAFSLHALALTAVCLGQSIAYTDRKDLKIHPATGLYCASGVLGSFISLTSNSRMPLVHVLSACKVGTTLVKYFPQWFKNLKSRSTTGFSVTQVVLDAMGCVMSTSQLVLDSIVMKSVQVLTGNAAKLLLGLVPLGFDSVFLVQRMVYNQSMEDEYEVYDQSIAEEYEAL